jgi:hypothetical protein
VGAQEKPFYQPNLAHPVVILPMFASGRFLFGTGDVAVTGETVHISVYDYRNILCFTAFKKVF